MLQGSRQLARSGSVRVIGYDARGHGESSAAPDGDYGYRSLVADLGAVLDDRGLERAVIARRRAGVGPGSWPTA